MKLHGLVKVKTNSGTTGHAITTPSVKPFEEIRAEADVSWISELQWPAPYYPASVAVLATLSSLSSIALQALGAWPCPIAPPLPPLLLCMFGCAPSSGLDLVTSCEPLLHDLQPSVWASALEGFLAINMSL